MKILAIDPATAMGYAYKDGKSIKYGTETFHNKDFDGAGMRLLRFKRWLSSFAGLDLIAYEAVSFSKFGNDNKLYNRWVSVIQVYCEENDIPYGGYNVKEVKKFWAGNGNASKEVMLRVAREKGFNPKDDNAADALAILHCALDSVGES